MAIEMLIDYRLRTSGSKHFKLYIHMVVCINKPSLCGWIKTLYKYMYVLYIYIYIYRERERERERDRES